MLLEQHHDTIVRYLESTTSDKAAGITLGALDFRDGKLLVVPEKVVRSVKGSRTISECPSDSPLNKKRFELFCSLFLKKFLSASKSGSLKYSVRRFLCAGSSDSDAEILLELYKKYSSADLDFVKSKEGQELIIAELEKEMETEIAKTKLLELKQQKGSLLGEKEKLKKEITEREREREYDQGSLVFYSSGPCDKNAQNPRHKKEIVKYKLKVAYHDRAIDALKSRIAEIDARVAGLNSSIETLKAKINKLEPSSSAVGMSPRGLPDKGDHRIQKGKLRIAELARIIIINKIKSKLQQLRPDLTETAQLKEIDSILKQLKKKYFKLQPSTDLTAATQEPAAGQSSEQTKLSMSS